MGFLNTWSFYIDRITRVTVILWFCWPWSWLVAGFRVWDTESPSIYLAADHHHLRVLWPTEERDTHSHYAIESCLGEVHGPLIKQNLFNSTILRWFFPPHRTGHTRVLSCLRPAHAVVVVGSDLKLYINLFSCGALGHNWMRNGVSKDRTDGMVKFAEKEHHSKWVNNLFN